MKERGLLLRCAADEGGCGAWLEVEVEVLHIA